MSWSGYEKVKSLSESIQKALKVVQILETHKMKSKLWKLDLKVCQIQEAVRNQLVLVWNGSKLCIISFGQNSLMVV